VLTEISVNLAHLRERVARAPAIPLTRVTLLCGPNGGGKSTVLSGLREFVIGAPSPGKTWTVETAPVQVEGECTAVCFFDTESDNLRTSNMDGVYDMNTLDRWFDSREMSHGQSNYRSLSDIIAGDEYDVVVLDQPEAGLDIDGLLLLREEILKSQKQFLVATHNPILLQLKLAGEASAVLFGRDEQYLERVLKVHALILEGKRAPRPAKRALPTVLRTKKRSRR
jgi:predicted ATPase